MSLWPERDAMRVLRRCRHAVETGDLLTDAQISYLRAQAMHLLIGPLRHELPDGYVQCLRGMLGLLEAAAALRAGEGPVA